MNKYTLFLNYFIMTNTKTIKSAFIELVTVFAVVNNGELEFREKTDGYSLDEFEVPETVDTEDKLEQYLQECIDNSSRDIGSIRFFCSSDFYYD